MTENDEKNIIKLLKRDGRKEKNFPLDVLYFFVQKITGLESENFMEMENKNKNKNMNTNDDNSDVDIDEDDDEEDDER